MSSRRSSIRPPCERAASQASKKAQALPRWMYPVGLGASLPQGGDECCMGFFQKNMCAAPACPCQRGTADVAGTGPPHSHVPRPWDMRGAKPHSALHLALHRASTWPCTWASTRPASGPAPGPASGAVSAPAPGPLLLWLLVARPSPVICPTAICRWPWVARAALG